MGGRTPRAFSFERQQGLSAGALKGWGETETTVLEDTRKVLCALRLSMKQCLPRNRRQTHLGFLESLVGRKGLTVAYCGVKESGSREY